MKILDADKIEIRIEKQKNNKNFTWCIYCRVEKSEETETVLMVKAKDRPFLLFQENKGNLVVNSKNVEKEITKVVSLRGYQIKKAKKDLKELGVEDEFLDDDL